MKFKSFFTIVFSFSLGAMAYADDSCPADVSKYNEAGLKSRTNMFDISSPNVANVFPSKLVQYGFEDHIKLKNGLDVTYKVGGCAHYAYSFAFKGQLVSRLSKSEKLARAAQLLSRLDLTDNNERDLLLKAISKAKKTKLVELENGVIVLPCGDANCSLVDRGDHEVTVSYDFPL